MGRRVTRVSQEELEELLEGPGSFDAQPIEAAPAARDRPDARVVDIPEPANEAVTEPAARAPAQAPRPPAPADAPGDQAPNFASPAGDAAGDEAAFQEPLPEAGPVPTEIAPAVSGALPPSYGESSAQESAALVESSLTSPEALLGEGESAAVDVQIPPAIAAEAAVVQEPSDASLVGDEPAADEVAEKQPASEIGATSLGGETPPASVEATLDQATTEVTSVSEPQAEVAEANGAEAELTEPAPVDPEQLAREAMARLIEDRARLNRERPIAAVRDRLAPVAPEARRDHDLQALRGLTQLAMTPVADAHLGLAPDAYERVAKFTATLGTGQVTAQQTAQLTDFASLYLQLGKAWSSNAIDLPNDRELASYGEAVKAPTTPLERSAVLYRLELNTTSTVTDEFAQVLWAMAEKMGLQGGRVVLPNSGFGTLSRMRPDDPEMRVTQIPNEPFAAEIAERAYPEDAVLKGSLDGLVLPGNYYDLSLCVAHVHPELVPVRGLPPYVKDDSINIEPDTPPLTEAEHLVYKQIKSLRPGGISIIVLPTATLLNDSGRSQAAHTRLARNAEILAAVPVSSALVMGPPRDFYTKPVTNADAFEDQIACTVLVMRTRPEIIHEEDAEAHWGEFSARIISPPQTFESMDAVRLRTAELERDGIYQGTEEFTQEVYRAAVGAIAERLLDSVPEHALIPRQDIRPAATMALRRPAALLNEAIAEANGVYVLSEDGLTLQYRLNGQLTDANVGGEDLQKIRLLLPIRDLVREALAHQQASNDDDALAEIQGRLHRAYDAFVPRFGPLLRPDNRTVFERDSFAPSLSQLETYDEESGRANKTVFFTERVVRRQALVERADSPEEAVSISMGRSGYIDTGLISTLLQRPWRDIRDELGDKVFMDPMLGRWVPQSQYLSGPVRAKLRTAIDAGRIDPEMFGRNAYAVQAVLPKNAGPEEIGYMMGAPWIPIDDYRRFVADKLQIAVENRDAAIKLTYDSLAARFSLSIDPQHCDARALVEYTSDTVTPKEIFEANLNGRSIRVMMDDPGYEPTGAENEKIPQVADHAGTAQVHVYQERVRDEFVEWCTSNPERAARMARIFNEKVNAFRDRTVDGSYLKFEMCSPRWVPMTHQRDAIARFIEDGNLLLAHGLGTGKTFELAGCAVESVRMGISSKPVLVTPKNTFAQTAAEIIQAYPTARVLLGETLSPKNRPAVREFISRAAMDSWDIILMTYDSFKAVGLSAAATQAVWQRKLAETLKEQTREPSAKNPLTRRQTILVKRIRELEDKAAAEHRSGDNQWGFERIGCDLLLIDEGQNFKNVDVATKMNVLGIRTTGSDRARDLEAKIDHIRSFNGNGRGVGLATATPISNTIAEIYTMMTYVDPSVLRSMNIRHFDAWASTFGRVQSLIEQKPAGDGFQIRERFIRFQNVPEMIRSFRMLADMRLDDDLVDTKVKRPALRTHLVTSEKGPLDEAFLKSLEVRARAVEAKAKLWSKDSVIVIMGDLRRSMLDPRLIDPRLTPDGTEVVSKLAETVSEVYNATMDIRGTQFIFCDQGVNPRPFSLYEEIRNQLMLRGIPREQIALISEYSKTNERHRLIQRFNDGRVRILLGSSNKIGVGTNAQKRCVAMHHVDIPMRPDHLIQRIGRGHRSGNMNVERGVDNYVYGKHGQTRQFEIIYNKAKAINQAFRNPDRAARNLDEELDVTLENIQVELTENDLLREKVRLDSDLKTIVLQKQAYSKTIAGYRLEGDKLAQRLREMEARTTSYREAVPIFKAYVAGVQAQREIDHADRDALQARASELRAVERQAQVELTAFRNELEKIYKPAKAPKSGEAKPVETDPANELGAGEAAAIGAAVEGAAENGAAYLGLTADERKAAIRRDKLDLFVNPRNAPLLATEATPEPEVPMSEEHQAKLDELINAFTVARSAHAAARESYENHLNITPGFRMMAGSQEVRRASYAGALFPESISNVDPMQRELPGRPFAHLGEIQITLTAPRRTNSLFSTIENGAILLSPDTHTLGLLPKEDEHFLGSAHLSAGGVSISVGLNATSQSNIIRVLNMVERSIGAMEQVEHKLQELRLLSDDLRRRSELPFPREEELATLQARKLALDTELLTQQGRMTPEIEARIMEPVLEAVHFKSGRPVHPERLAAWNDGQVGLEEAQEEDELQEAAGELAQQILGPPPAEAPQAYMAPQLGNG